ncbi:EAL domain-containing protein [Kineothrix sp. MSJ-39]|nr:EAL domain-containing protein [Kineothrix sp. MSJ-39]
MKPEPVCGSEAVIISGAEEADGQTAVFLKEAKISSLITVPISIRGTISMYLCVLMARQEHKWSAEEIRYTTDMAKVLQSILDNRIARNSIVSSYQSLTQILNTVGSCIYVRDKETGQVLFCNDLMQHEFEQELKKGTINRLLEQAESALVKNGYYELKHPSRKHWYDLHQTEIDWVDGRKVSFSALYDITDKKLYQRKIEQQAYTDFLTGLYNRMCCERDLAQYIEKAEADSGRGGLLYLDLDDFKHINDGLGHQYGDVLLKSISHSLQRIPEIHNTCYRMGGDEFVIVVPPESITRFDGIVEEIKAIFSKPWFLKNADYYCTMSMGICYFPEDGSSVQDLIKKADIAMYEAKKSGKNRVAVYSDNISSISNKRLDMEKNMRDATAGDYREFEVYYQPIIDIQKEGTPCVGAEALVRWNSATLGFIPPSDFIPLAEYLGLINPIGNHVMKEACKACKYWNTHGHPEFKVNVNLSVVQLLQTDIVETIEETIRQSGIDPHNLTLEVTESLAINDMERMKKILNQIRGLGARIALDDFGTGYSSLNHIREIPLDVIKVDQSFVSDLTEDSYSQSFIKMVAELAGAIGVSICIEGIETREQYKVLEGMKVRLVQGYYFDRPMTRKDFDEKYI